MSNTIKKLNIEMETWDIKIVYKKWTIYFSKNELANLFSIEKRELKDILKKLNITNKIKHLKTKDDKIIKIYSFEIALLVWYKLKDFNTTKELIKVSRFIKENYTQKEFALTRFREKYKQIKNIFTFKFLY